MKTKTVRLILFVLSVVVLIAAFMAQPAKAASDAALPPDILGIVLNIALGFASLAGVSKLSAVLVQVAKLLHLASDGTAAQWAAGFNLVGFVVLVAFGVFQPSVVLSVLDGYAAQIAEIALFVLGFVLQMTGSAPTYAQLKDANIPLLSFSHSSD